MAKANDTCNYPDCTNLVGKHGAKGYCSKHYYRTRPPCIIEGCSKRQSARGMCSMHYARWKQTGDPHKTPSGRIVFPKGVICAVEGCGQPRRKRDWCAAHYSQWKRKGEVKPFSYKWQDGEERPCVVCGERARGRSKYCGGACQVVASRWSREGKDRPESFVCVLCGKDVTFRARRGKRLIRTDTFYCQDCGRDSAEARRWKMYGVTPEQYAAALERGCEICGARPEKLDVDHDHSCCDPSPGAACCWKCTRGFLCGNCNRAIGLLQDNPEVAANAAKYLATNARV